MAIVLAWIMATLAILGLLHLSYKVIASLPDAIERYVRLRESIKRERLITEKLKQEVLNEQLKTLDEE